MTAFGFSAPWFLKNPNFERPSSPGKNTKMQFEDMNARDMHRPYKKLLSKIQGVLEFIGAYKQNKNQLDIDRYRKYFCFMAVKMNLR